MPLLGLLDAVADVVHELLHVENFAERPHEDTPSSLVPCRHTVGHADHFGAFIDRGASSPVKPSVFSSLVPVSRYSRSELHEFLGRGRQETKPCAAQLHTRVLTNFGPAAMIPPDPFDVEFVRRPCPQYVFGPDRQLHDCGPDERGRLPDMEHDCLLASKDFGKLMYKGLMYRARRPANLFEEYYSRAEHEKISKRPISSGGDNIKMPDRKERRSMSPTELAQTKAEVQANRADKKFHKAEMKRQEKEMKRAAKAELREMERQRKFEDKFVDQLIKEYQKKGDISQKSEKKHLKKLAKEEKKQGRMKDKAAKRRATQLAAADKRMAKHKAKMAEDAAEAEENAKRVLKKEVADEMEKERIARGGATLPSSGVFAEMKNPWMHMKCVTTKFGASMWRVRECNPGTHEWRLYCNKGEPEGEMPDNPKQPKFEGLSLDGVVGDELDNGLCDGQLSIQCLPKHQKATY